MTFPGAGAQVYYNEAGEPTGWDYPGYDEGPDRDDFDEFDDYDEDSAEWIICDECGYEYEDGDPEIQKHEQDTGHKRWS